MIKTLSLLLLLAGCASAPEPRIGVHVDKGCMCPHYILRTTAQWQR